MSKISDDAPATYRIRVQGLLDPSWANRLGGMTIVASSESDASVTTTLTGELADQNALENVLTTLYNLGLPLLSVDSLADVS